MAEIMEALRRIEHNQKQQGQELKQQGHKLDAMNRLMGVVVERQAYSEAGPLLARVFPELQNMKVSTFKVSWLDASFLSLAVKFHQGKIHMNPLPFLTWKGDTGTMRVLNKRPRDFEVNLASNPMLGNSTLIHGEIKLTLGWSSLLQGFQQATEMARTLRQNGWKGDAYGYIAYFNIKKTVSTALRGFVTCKFKPEELANHLDNLTGSTTSIAMSPKRNVMPMVNGTAVSPQVSGVEAAALTCRLLSQYNLKLFLLDLGQL